MHYVASNSPYPVGDKLNSVDLANHILAPFGTSSIGSGQLLGSGRLGSFLLGGPKKQQRSRIEKVSILQLSLSFSSIGW